MAYQRVCTGLTSWTRTSSWPGISCKAINAPSLAEIEDPCVDLVNRLASPPAHVSLVRRSGIARVRPAIHKWGG